MSTNEQNEARICVGYHAGCTDGMGAAAAVYHALGDEGVLYVPLHHQAPIPDVLADTAVYLVDFCYPREQLIELSRRIHSLVILDHHQSAQKDLEGIESELHCPAEIVFDMQRSGAVIAWDYFHTQPLPALLAHIQDRDLWRFELARTKEVTAGIRLNPEWRTWLNQALDTVAAEGEGVVKFLSQTAERISSTEPTYVPLVSHTVPYVNLQGFLTSETLHLALEKYPDAPFALSYHDLPNKQIRNFSLRSRSGSNVDVSKIARWFGGGGHKHAAGFRLPLDQLNHTPFTGSFEAD